MLEFVGAIIIFAGNYLHILVRDTVKALTRNVNNEIDYISQSRILRSNYAELIKLLPVACK